MTTTDAKLRIRDISMPDFIEIDEESEDDIESDELFEEPESDEKDSYKDCVEYIKNPKITDLKCGRGDD